MPPSAIVRAFAATTTNTTIAAQTANDRRPLRPLPAFASVSLIDNSETTGVFADAGNDQPSAVQSFDDGDDVQREDGDPAEDEEDAEDAAEAERRDRKSTRLNSSHGYISYA